jgi:hypothetical protein
VERAAVQSHQQESRELQATVPERAETVRETETAPTFLVGQHTVEELLAIVEEEASRKWRRIIPRGVLAVIGVLLCIIALQTATHINPGPLGSIWVNMCRLCPPVGSR